MKRTFLFLLTAFYFFIITITYIIILWYISFLKSNLFGYFLQTRTTTIV